MESRNLAYLDRAQTLMEELRGSARSDGLLLRSRLAELMRRIGSWTSNQPSDGEVASVDVELRALATEVRRFASSGLGGP